MSLTEIHTVNISIRFILADLTNNSTKKNKKKQNSSSALGYNTLNAVTPLSDITTVVIVAA